MSEVIKAADGTLTETATTFFGEVTNVGMAPFSIFNAEDNKFVSQKSAGWGMLGAMGLGLVGGTRYGEDIPFLNKLSK